MKRMFLPAAALLLLGAGWPDTGRDALTTTIAPGGAITVRVDRDRLEHAGAGMLGPDALRAKRAYADNLLTLAVLPLVIRDAYAADPALDATRWTVRLDGREMFRFDLDRLQLATVPWPTLHPADVPAALLHFSYNLRFTHSMAQSTGTIAGD